MNESRIYQLAWLVLIGLAIYLSAVISLEGTLVGSRGHKLGTDFAVFWSAARAPLSVVYDWMAMTDATKWVGAAGPRPFLSPPTMLFWLKPFSILPYWAALSAWLAVGVGTWFATSSRLVGFRAASLSLLSPPVLLCFLAGQVTFLVGALMALGFLAKRPIVSGLCFAIGATMKPQALMLVPLGLLLSREWRSLGWTVLFGVAIGLASVVVHGSLWLGWLHAMQSAPDIFSRPGGAYNLGTVTGLAHLYHIEGLPKALMVGSAALLGLALVYRVFRTTTDPMYRYGAIVCGYLLCSPYAGGYELAMLAPLMSALLLNRRVHPLIWLGASLSFSTMGMAATALLFGATLLLSVPSERNPRPHAHL